MSRWQLGKVKRHHVVRAARHWEKKNGKYLTFRGSRLYDVEIAGRFYPPKAISSLAYHFATGEEIKPSEFVGAREGPWHVHLKSLGFSIHLKSDISPLWPDQVGDSKYSEGHKLQVTVNRYERDPKARAACIACWGTSCTVCILDFAERYGDLGAGFIHVHHLVPLSKIGKAYEVDPREDLRPVCPNCHAMLHKSGLSISQLQKRLRGT